MLIDQFWLILKAIVGIFYICLLRVCTREAVAPVQKLFKSSLNRKTCVRNTYTSLMNTVKSEMHKHSRLRPQRESPVTVHEHKTRFTFVFPTACQVLSQSASNTAL